MLKWGDTSCLVTFGAVCLSQAARAGRSHHVCSKLAPGGPRAVSVWLVLFWGFTEHLEGGWSSQFEALIPRKGSVPQEAWRGAQELQSVRSGERVPGAAHQALYCGPQRDRRVLPAGSLCPLPLSQGRSRRGGAPAVIGGSCCPVSSADCHPTCAPGNTPSSSGLGF